MENITINHFAVLACAAANLLVGAVWYSPVLFYKAWKKENNLTDDHFKGLNFGKMYTISFLLSLIISYNMAFFLGDATTDWKWGLTAGFLTGFGWAATIFAVIALFELKSWRYILINGGYIVFYFSLIGFILGIWR
ncbi:DUF1761 family protein [Leptobacterium flavescens]|uniref:DUF1761 family protein n=1 Tax=Leptobacterium flavescens TaxID=472055 RepID=A0A6P0UU22_9FLAO|nr:DUF1761 domain-containing protein [Leptobacterium flavescens]NER14323.1 DUF1761 family protein [Leptobacterium flavescens]